MKTIENLSPKNSQKDTESKVVPLNVTPSKSLRPQKSMVRVKSFKPNRIATVEKVRIKRS